MGRPKESLPICGTTMLDWQCRTLMTCTEVVVTVGRDSQQPLPEIPPEVDVTSDEMPGEGPLAAIAAGLRRLRDEHGFTARDAAIAVGCDQPLLTAETIRWMSQQIDDADVLMPQANDKLQPLTAIYRVAALQPALDLLAAGSRRPRELASVTKSRILTEPELRQHDATLSFLKNLNNPDDYEAVRQQLER